MKGMRQATEKDRKVGKSVYVRGEGFGSGWAKIASLYQDIPGGVNLDRAIGGFHIWNIDELQVRE